MIEDKYDVIFKAYKTFMQDKLDYDVTILKHYNGSKVDFPLVTLELTNNIDADSNSLLNIDYFEWYYFTINIYTKDMVVNEEQVASNVINNQICNLTMEFFRKINMKKVLNKFIPNIDNNILRRNLQYEGQFGNREQIIRR